MWKTLSRAVWGALFLFVTAGVAQADSVGFDPAVSNVTVGQMFDVDIIGDFVELAGGEIDLGFDSLVVQINSVVIDPHFDFLPDGGGPAVGNVWPGIGFDVFVNDPATGNFAIATINITALAVGTSPLNILGSSQFFSASDVLSPTLNGGTVNVIPLPAAWWLLLSGLSVFGIRARRRLKG